MNSGGSSVIAPPDDTFEREADRVANNVVSQPAGRCSCGGIIESGGECATCRQKRAPSTGAIGALAGTPSWLQNITRAPGATLDPSTAAWAQSHFDADLRHVRIHTDNAAADSAQRLEANAYTIGPNIVFARDRFSPGTVAGKKLLAHELTHVLQEDSRIRRDPNHTPADANASVDPNAAGPQVSTITGPVQPASHAADYDPCAVNVATLTNYQLLAENANCASVVGRGRDAPGFFDFRNLKRRIEAESRRRVGMGHAWLANVPSSIPQSLYKIVEGANGTFQVVQVPGASDSGEPTQIASAPLMTESQFQSFLGSNQIETIGPDTYRQRVTADRRSAGMASTMVAGGRLYNTPFDVLLMDPFARPLLSANGNVINKWSGRLGEAGFASRSSSGFGFALDDLNARTWVDRRGQTHTPAQENFPTFDYERLRGTPGFEVLGAARVSVKTSLQPNQGDRFAYYREGMAGMLEAPSARSSLPTYLANDPQFSGTNATQYAANRSQAIAESFMAINADDVAAFRRLLSDPTTRETGSANTVWNDGNRRQGPRRITGWRTILEGVMRDNPVTIDTPSGRRTFNSPDALDQALTANQITNEQHVNAQRTVGRRAASQILAHNLETSAGVSLRGARRGITLPEAQLRPLLTPEYIRTQRMGGGLGGEVRAAGAAGLGGAGAGGLIAVFTTLGTMYFDEQDHPNWENELALSGGLGALEPVLNFLRELSVLCKYIPALRLGWRSKEKRIRVMSAMKNGLFAPRT